MDKINLLLADDHDVVRTGLKSFLEGQGDFEVIAEARNGAEAIELALEYRPDLVLMDVTMPDLDGLDATRRLKKIMPNCLVLALTVHEDKQYFMEMLAAGASGYITKQAAGDELISAIRTVAAGNVYLHPALARWLLNDYQQLIKQVKPKPPVGSLLDLDENQAGALLGLEVLSMRERQVLELVADGFTNQEIGHRLNLSHKTIARHRERIMKKLSLHSRTELVKFAIRTGLISP
ncbi:MAG: response regulator transcription factor [Anaerolineales bacterium]|nr:response regulator transcription factor [Anaerolineales bacterium]